MALAHFRSVTFVTDDQKAYWQALDIDLVAGGFLAVMHCATHRTLTEDEVRSILSELRGFWPQCPDTSPSQVLRGVRLFKNRPANRKPLAVTIPTP